MVNLGVYLKPMHSRMKNKNYKFLQYLFVCLTKGFSCFLNLPECQIKMISAKHQCLCLKKNQRLDP